MDLVAVVQVVGDEGETQEWRLSHMRAFVEFSSMLYAGSVLGINGSSRRPSEQVGTMFHNSHTLFRMVQMSSTLKFREDFALVIDSIRSFEVVNARF